MSPYFSSVHLEWCLGFLCVQSWTPVVSMTGDFIGISLDASTFYIYIF